MKCVSCDVQVSILDIGEHEEFTRNTDKEVY